MSGTELVPATSGQPARQDAALDDLGADLVRSEQVLEPGYYWRAKEALDECPEIAEGDALLLVELIDFEEKLHSVQLLRHPRHGEGRYTFLIEDFVASFEPCQDADAIRAAEQQAILNRVTELQQELVSAQANPQLMLEAIKPQVDQAEKKHQYEAGQRQQRAENDRRERDRNLSKIHRRAARRSAAKGNPLALPRVAVGTNVSQLLTAGIDEGGVVQLREIADKQLVLAQAQANWLTRKTEEITGTLKQLAPYAAEKAAVALARSSDALKRVERIRQGIESLDLYTGKGVDVFEVRDGLEAPTHVPLMIVQGKRFMEEELAVHADISVGFDWRDQPQFFAELAQNDALLNQVFPSERCVISMAVTRHERSYGSDRWAQLINNLQNQLVFLLVRNGSKVHVVYSATPSHEAARRLFPTSDELGDVFRGIDGSTITLRDVEFGERKKDFDDLALHYRRFLILLCGLDHRLRLLGEFYPPEQQVNFMSADFQARYMRFYADQEVGAQVGDDLPCVTRWIETKNKVVQSGSRVFLMRSAGAINNSPEMKRRRGLRFREKQFEYEHIAQQEGARFFVTLATRDSWGDERSEPNVKCYLEGETSSGDQSWWLCLDEVSVDEIRRYLGSRRNWGMGVGYLRLFRRLEVFLASEAAAEAPARAYLLEQATTHGGLPEAVARPALDAAVRNWRAARRGAALPGLDHLGDLNEVLSLVAPEGYVPAGVERLLQRYLEASASADRGRQPLLLTRSGANRYVLYTTASDLDREPYPSVLAWGWVRRVVLEPTKAARHLREVSQTLTWLHETLPAAESELRRYAGADAWFHKDPEPIRLRTYAAIKRNLAEALVWEPVLRAGTGGGIPAEIFTTLAATCAQRERANRTRSVLHLSIGIPVAVYGGGRKLSVVYMTARAERVLYAYGDDAQRAAILAQFSSPFANAHRAQEILTAPLEWALRVSETCLDGSALQVHKDQIPGESSYQMDWMRLSICQNSKRERGKGDRPGIKGDGKPSLNRYAHAALSLNRAFDELAGVGPLLRRQFYRNLLDRARWDCRWEAPEKAKAKRKQIMSERYTPRVAQLSPLVWRAGRNRSIAQSVFVAPLRTKVTL